ncbi:lymphocyte function-associated antigen 3 isoform X2 [Fundulus heteroclitus]|uniref:lymphocyte function-associated antigen 3 isoform X2 n=1 Tax=Fundulus heteroclitus TaxID=8078 RepID=UPI00165B3D04|nr:lymphocyte function-associated antigen 3 isoform X2 [Fundulus heteroclitus]
MMLFTPIKTPVGPAAWLVVLLVAWAAADETIYAKLGVEVTLKPKPGSVTDATKSITWKVGSDLAMVLDDGFLTSYRHFKARGHLNNRTGEMTITNLTYEDSQVYTTEIDGAVINHTISLHVISPVPVPTITSSCSLDASTCTLTCEGNTTRAGPVTYTWMFDSVVVPHDTATYIIKEHSSDVKEFKCKMKNPLGEETSKTFNIFEHAVESGPKISTGVTVFVILLVAVVVLVIVHRLKAGEFFFNKSSFPWQGDFWRNTRGQIPVDSNGSTSPPPEVPAEEGLLKD